MTEYVMRALANHALPPKPTAEEGGKTGNAKAGDGKRGRDDDDSEEEDDEPKGFFAKRQRRKAAEAAQQ
jgi:hypothetical protein